MVQSIVNIKGKQIDPILANNVDQTVQQVYPLVISNVFTPNGDGVNDTFVIPGLETYTENEITIINRWGNVVYQKTNYKNDWDGSGLVEGTYYYVLRAKNKAGVWDTYKGYLTLLRTRL
jgi:gliding motility-associated-like protein